MTILWMLPLLFGTASGPAPPVFPVSLEALENEGEPSYATLLSEYDAAVAAWKDALSNEEDKKARRALRKQKPAIEFYLRFKLLADAGEGRALVWMMDHYRDAGHKRKDAPAVMIDASAKLVNQHVNADWFEDAVVVMFEQKRAIGTERLEALSLEIIAKCESKVMQAKTLAKLGQFFERSKEEEGQVKGKLYFDRLEQDYDDAVLGQALSGERFKKRFLVVGKVAPDFAMQTAAGKNFKLSDYRGKVTLIDFWGFW